MNTQYARQKWFPCSSPDRLLPRQDAVNLILKHADQRLVMFTDLTDERIRSELPTAWRREHQQADMFRDAAASVANDEYLASGPSRWDTLKKALKGMFEAR